MEFRKMCRSCLSVTEDFVYDLFLTSTKEMFSFCTSLEVSENDCLPRSICSICYELLNQLSLFKQKCIQSNLLLQRCIKAQGYISQENLTQVKVENATEGLAASEENDFKVEIEIEENHDGADSDDKSFHDASIEKDYSKDEGFPISCNLRSGGGDKKKKLRHKKVKERCKRKPPKQERNVGVTFNCPQCNKLFRYYKSLQEHIKTHDKVKEDIFCKICSKKFTLKTSLTKHHKTAHTKLKPLECSVCGNFYKTLASLKNHKKLQHKPRRDHICHICGGNFKSVIILQKHVETHKENRERNHICSLCEKRFLTSDHLQCHMYLHQEKRFKCDICSYAFYKKSVLAKHMLIHQGVKPYACKLCDKAYSTRAFLVVHGRTHSGERPFACEHCFKTFISRNHLRDHKRTHTGEKPYKCDKCSMAFVQSGSLQRHVRTHKEDGDV